LYQILTDMNITKNKTWTSKTPANPKHSCYELYIILCKKFIIPLKKNSDTFHMTFKFDFFHYPPNHIILLVKKFRWNYSVLKHFSEIVENLLKFYWKWIFQLTYWKIVETELKLLKFLWNFYWNFSEILLKINFSTKHRWN